MARRQHQSARVIPFRKPAERRPAQPTGDPLARRLWLAMLIALPLAAFTAVLFWDGGPEGEAMPLRVSAGDNHRAQFSRCAFGSRANCVIDGDTIWYQGTKIRIADINTPELSEPECPREAELAEQATQRLTQLLNQGAFSLEDIDRSHDQYGRRLQVITRGGASLGERLVDEGLAETWTGSRSSWC
jgi:hypothetical protein